MIGRADIEESKSFVAMDAWKPQASYPCGNFSVTPTTMQLVSEGSLGLDFSPINTHVDSHAGFCPCTLRVISILAEPTLGHLRCALVDVPPQPNSPSGSVRIKTLVQGYYVQWSFTCVYIINIPPTYTTYKPIQYHIRVKLNRVFFPR